MKIVIFLTATLLIQTTFARQFSREARELFNDQEKSLTDLWFSGGDEKEDLMKLVKVLVKSKTGKLLLFKAKKKAALQGKTLLDVLNAGEGSITDTTLVRRFSPSRPDRVVYEAHSKVVINRDLNMKNAILDLAHELTHFTMRDTFNPYESHFTADQFVMSTVEGKGGEVDAFLIECKVLRELFPSSWKKHSNCEYVYDQNGKFSKELGIQYFYKIGPFMEQFRAGLNRYNLDTQEFSSLSEETPIFISSAYGLPYPVAALKEYQAIMDRVCQNDRKRLDIIKAKLNAPERAPADLSIRNNYKDIITQYNKRCFLPADVALNP
jgi:hypothetical protein